MPDITTFGEALLRLSAPAGDRLETANELNMHVAGAESNVAVAASRLGCDAVWLSKLPNSALGQRIQTELRRHGVTPEVAVSTEARQGIYFLEMGRDPRDAQVIYDRANSAITDVTSEELSVDRIIDSNVFFTSGITPALSKSAEAVTQKFIATAADSNTSVAFDINYRKKLWSPEKAADTLTDFLSMVDILFAPARDIETIFEEGGSPQTMAENLFSRFGCKIIVITQGSEGAVAYDNGEYVNQPAFTTNTFDPIGTGDAFVGGFLTQYLQGNSTHSALEYGAAAASLKRTISGDLAIINPSDVEDVIKNESSVINR